MHVVTALRPSLPRPPRCTVLSSRCATTGLHLLHSPLRSTRRALLPLISHQSVASRRSFTVQPASELPPTDCDSCFRLPSRPAHSIHAVLITDAPATSWPGRLSTSDTPPPHALCAAIDANMNNRLRAAASTSHTSAQTRILASVARITRHSNVTSALQSAATHNTPSPILPPTGPRHLTHPSVRWSFGLLIERRQIA